MVRVVGNEAASGWGGGLIGAAAWMALKRK